MRLSKCQLSLHQLTQGRGKLGDLDDGLDRHGGQQPLDGSAQRPDPNSSTGCCRSSCRHTACRCRSRRRHGNKLGVEAAQITYPTRDFQADPSLGQQSQRGAPLIEDLDQCLEGFPHGDKTIGEALRPLLQAAIPGHRLKFGIKVGQLVFEPGQRPVLGHHPVKLGEVVLGIGDKPGEQTHVVGSGTARLGCNLVHQGRDGLAAQLARLRELLQFGGILASHQL